MQKRIVILCGFSLFVACGLHAQESPSEGQQPLCEFSSLPCSSPSFLSSSLPAPSSADPSSPGSLPSSSSSSPAPDTSSQFLLPSSPTELSTSARQLTLGDRFDIYMKSFTEPGFVVGPSLGAADNQWRNNPVEWGQGSDAFGRRLASGYARAGISNTIRAGFAAVDHEDPRYHRSGLHGVWPRARYALVHTFITPIDVGGQTFAFSSVAGSYGAAFIANAWYPASEATVGHALVRGSTAMAWRIAGNEFREFGPDLGRLFHHH